MSSPYDFRRTQDCVPSHHLRGYMVIQPVTPLGDARRCDSLHNHSTHHNTDLGEEGLRQTEGPLFVAIWTVALVRTLLRGDETSPAVSIWPLTTKTWYDCQLAASARLVILLVVVVLFLGLCYLRSFGVFVGCEGLLCHRFQEGEVRQGIS